MQNKELAKKLHKPIIIKFEQQKVHSSFINNIWGAGLADMQLLSKSNKGIHFCFYALLIFIVNIIGLLLWKIKKVLQLLMIFKKYYMWSMKSWREKNDIEMYLTYNEGKSVVAERFIRTLKNNIYEDMTSISRDVHNNKLDEIVNKYNNTYHSTIKIKPTDVKSSTYIDFDKRIITKILNSKLLTIQEYQNKKNIFAKRLPAILF